MDPFIGELKLVGFPYPPQGWMACEGQQLPIAQHQALFALLGVTYGGDGVTTFALPDLRGRVPVGTGPTLLPGQRFGEDSVTLTVAQMPAHTHAVQCHAEPGTQAEPINGFWSADAGGNALYAATADATMSASAVSTAGSSQPHPNRQPYQCLYWIIAIEGVFPSRQ